MIFRKLAALTQRAPRAILLVAALFLLLAGVFGAPVSDRLPAGGYDDPAAQSTRAQAVLAHEFGAGGMPIVFEVTAPAGVADPAVRQRADTVLDALRRSPHIRQLTSYWTASPAVASSLVSADRRTGLIVAQVLGSDGDAPPRAHDIARSVVGAEHGVEVKAGGQAIAYYDINRQSRLDLLMVEAIAIPFTFLALVWIFGSAIAALLPIAVAVCAVAGAMAALRALYLVTDVSVFAVNLATALCLALAIDYSLFIVNRYREELTGGLPPDRAIARTLSTAGRTVFYSAVTVGLALAAMAVFPMYFLRSLAYAGLVSVLLCLTGALLLAPALLIVLGARIEKWDIRKPLYRLFGREAGRLGRPQDSFFYRGAVFAMRRAVVVVSAVATLFVVLGLPFLGMKLAYPDDRILPADASARQAGDTLREQFPRYGNAIRIVLPSGAPAAESVADYAVRLSGVDDVLAVAAPDGTYVHGRRVAADSYGAGRTDAAAYLTVSSATDPYSAAGKAQLATVERVRAPAPAFFGGPAQQNVDGVGAITKTVPLALALIAATTLILVFLLTGSVLLPVKALVMNLLSLTAAFGAMVWIFQNGHLGGFGATTTGTVTAAFPPLIFCVAFGLSMDYEVFVLSRMREEWLRNGRRGNQRAVAIGLARTGRIVTAAAAVMAIVFVAMIGSRVQSMRMLGTALAITVLLDAFLVRTVLVPAFMRLLGRANWWAPAPLARLHEKWGLGEAAADATPPADPEHKPDNERKPMMNPRRYRTILVYINGTADDEQAVATAAGLAAATDGRLVLVCPYEKEALRDAGATAETLKGEAFLLHGSYLIDEALRLAKQRATACGARHITVRAVNGSPRRALLTAAADTDADLVVVGSRNGLAHRTFGGLPAAMIRRAPIDVLVAGPEPERRPRRAAPTEAPAPRLVPPRPGLRKLAGVLVARGVAVEDGRGPVAAGAVVVVRERGRGGLVDEVAFVRVPARKGAVEGRLLG